MDVYELFCQLPKAELHLHIEGSFEPQLMFAIAKRNNVVLPYATVDELREAYAFSELQDFLDIYYQGMSVLLKEQDYFDLTMAYLKRCKADNVTHVEIFFDPQGHTLRGVAFETVISGIHRALSVGQDEFGISFRLIMSFLRHLSEEDGFQTLNEAKPFLHLIHGVGLDSSENGNPPEKFERLFKACGELGLKRVAHAGEEGPPAYILGALNALQVDRIDHGNRSLDDDALVDHLVASQMGLTICPLSNLKLCVVKDMKDHPLRLMLQKGLRVSINSDDPAYFGGYMNDNFKAIHAALNVTVEEAVQLARNSFTTSFLPEEEVKSKLAEINAIIPA